MALKLRAQWPLPYPRRTRLRLQIRSTNGPLPSLPGAASFKRLLGSCLPELPRRLVKGLGARRLGVALPVGRADLADVLCRRGQWRPLPSFGFSPRVHNLEDVVDNMVLHDIRVNRDDVGLEAHPISECQLDDLASVLSDAGGVHRTS